MESVKKFLRDKPKLIVNEAKSRIVKLCEATYLGFAIRRGKIRWSEKSRDRFKATVRKITRRTRGVSPRKVIDELGLYVRGAFNYYAPGITYRESRELDSWLRRKMRAYYWTAMARSAHKPAERSCRAATRINSGAGPAPAAASY